MLEELKSAIAEAKEEYAIARRNEELADPDYLEIAMEATDIALLRLNNLYRQAKLVQITSVNS